MKIITNRDNIQAWSSVSKQMIEEFGEEGDASRRFILNPVLFSLFGDVAERHILDAGCGTGYLCRMLAKRGAKVTGIEPATTLFEYAVEREEQDPIGITYVQEDLSEWTITHTTFDIVIANMVFMDIPDYRSAMHNCISALKSGGQFVFSLLHPCFDEINSPDFEQGYHAKGYIRIDEYFDEFVTKQTWGFHFHRPLSSYLNYVIDKGCLIQKVIEPELSPSGVAVLGENNRNMHVPAFIVINAVKR